VRFTSKFKIRIVITLVVGKPKDVRSWDGLAIGPLIATGCVPISMIDTTEDMLGE